MYNIKLVYIYPRHTHGQCGIDIYEALLQVQITHVHAHLHENMGPFEALGCLQPVHIGFQELLNDDRMEFI